jgi:UDP:flavonoid glycosyltransferase YjiC (YdhE family)
VGTLGRALRHRCPLLVEPYGNDQFYNALLVKKLGYGSAMNPLRLTAESVARVLSEKVLPARDRLAGAQALIQKEDGLGRACEIVEEHLEPA